METPLAAETISPEEAKFTAQLAARLKEKIVKDNPTGIMRRDAHPKMHGLVNAEFMIEPNLPAELRVGLFKTPNTYQAWIRFPIRMALLILIRAAISGAWPSS